MSKMKLIFTVFVCFCFFSICCLLHARTISDRIDFSPGFDNGSGPVSVAINTETSRIYVGNSITGNISVIDDKGNQVIGSIPAFERNSGLECAPKHFTFNNLTNRLYVVGDSCISIDVPAEDHVLIVDSLTNKVSNRFSVRGFGRLTDIGVHSGINKVYLSSFNDIVVIDGETNEHIETVVDAVAVQSGDQRSTEGSDSVNSFLGSLVTVGNNIYFAFDKRIAVIDVLTDEVTETIQLNGDIFDMAVDLARNRIYCAVDDGVAVIDSLSNTVLMDISIAEAIKDVAVNTETGIIHAFSGQKIFTIDGTTNSIVNTIEIEGHAIDVDSENNSIFVVNKDVDDLMVIDETDSNLLTLIELDARPSGVCINPITNRIYTSIMDRRMLLVTDGTTKEVIDKIMVGEDPVDVAVNSVTGQIYVANSGSNDISVIDGAIDEVVETVALEASPMRIGIHPGTNQIYIMTDKSIIVMDGNTNDLVDTVDTQVSSITVNTVTNLIYAMTSEGIIVIDGFINEITNTINMTEGKEILINPATNKIYVTSKSGHEIIVVDALTNDLAARFRIGFGFVRPMELAVHPNKNHIYLTHTSEPIQGFFEGDGVEARYVSIINGATNEVISSLKLELAVARNPRLGRIFIDPIKELIYASGESDIFVISVSELKSLSVTTSREEGIRPVRIRKRARTAEVLALDENNQPIPNVIVNASVNGNRVRLDTEKAVTNEEGKALFDYRFMLSEQPQEIVFSAEGIETCISDRRKEEK